MVLTKNAPIGFEDWEAVTRFRAQEKHEKGGEQSEANCLSALSSLMTPPSRIATLLSQRA